MFRPNAMRPLWAALLAMTLLQGCGFKGPLTLPPETPPERPAQSGTGAQR